LTVVIDAATEAVVAAGYVPPRALASRIGHHGVINALTEPPAQVARAFAAYSRGDAHALDRLTVRVEATAFAQAVTTAMRQVTGTVSYGQLAALAGYPGAARAAGTVCSSNPVAVIVPCHRVVRADGALGNYGYGVHIKEALLRAEGAL
jgi:methylated-DNA-[protein]-cysteine S-methyltransferase